MESLTIAILSLIIVVVYVFIANMLDNTIKSAESIEKKYNVSYVTGHSKGGNLALVSSMCSNYFVKNKIILQKKIGGKYNEKRKRYNSYNNGNNNSGGNSTNGNGNSGNGGSSSGNGKPSRCHKSNH